MSTAKSGLSIAAIVIGIIAIALSGFSLAIYYTQRPPIRVFDSGMREIFMTTVEYKGSTKALSAPTTDPSTLGTSYGFKWINQTAGEWQVSAYAWEPSIVTVQQGDTVHLHIFGVNGDTHPSTIEGYNEDFTVTRGRITEVEFVADKAGIFKITCSTHQPHMTALLVVLPKS